MLFAKLKVPLAQGVQFPALNPNPALQVTQSPLSGLQVSQSVLQFAQGTVPSENCPVVQAVQVPLVSRPSPGLQERQKASVFLQVRHPVQVSQVLTPPVENVLFMQTVQAPVLLSKPDPAGHAVQSPFSLLQVEHDDEQFAQVFVPPVEKVPGAQVVQEVVLSNPKPTTQAEQTPVY